MTATAVNAKDVKKLKDALVASLFELSKAAQEASTATVNFFNAIEQPLPGDIAGIAKLARAVGDVEYSVAGAQSASQKKAAAAAAKKAKDPNAPKKPLTMYFAYSAIARKEIMEDRARKGLPPLSSLEMTHETSKKWKDLPIEEKEEWKRKYNEELELYQVEKERYIDDLIGSGAEIPEEYQKAAHTRKRKIEFANASNLLKHPKLEHHAIADAVGSVENQAGVVDDDVHLDNEEDVAAAASAAVAAAAAAVEDAVSESDGEKRSKKEKKKKKKEKKHDRERERERE